MPLVIDFAVALAKTARQLAETLDEPLADTYAQTIVCTLFTAHLHHQTLQDISKPFPFLRQLFDHLTYSNTHEKASGVMGKIEHTLQSVNFSKTFNTEESAIQFYEHFLAAYSPGERKSRGVFYTPQPAVKYIVQAVDDILQQEFQLPEGLTDSSFIQSGNQTIHRVQILDPALGTGTFLAEVIKYIAHTFPLRKNKKTTLNQTWNEYAFNDLLPRLHGIEVLMSSYLMGNIKLAAVLHDTGITLDDSQRLNILHANALELQDELQPMMVILGNPPYNVSTANKGLNTLQLIKKYKENLVETKTNLDDDYIKFIAWGEQNIEHNQNGGILAFITNNSFLDGVTHRNMRKSLLNTFDKIYILNLHGNTRKKETCPDGSKDENIFSIMQGTSINIFIRLSNVKTKTPCKVFYADLFGTRSKKFQFLKTHHLISTGFSEIIPAKNYFFFIPKDFSHHEEYAKGFSMAELFLTYHSGIKTDRDSLFIDCDKHQLASRMKKLLSGNFNETFRETYRIVDSSSYKITKAIQGKTFDETKIQRVCYRPFDERWIYYDPAILSRAGDKVQRHMLRENIALLTSRLVPISQSFNRVFVSTTLTDGHAISDQTYVFPLYTYESNGRRRSNLNAKILEKIVRHIGTLPKDLEIFDYVYGVLHDSAYRKKFDEMLKIDFPRVLMPKDVKEFEHFVRIGKRLRQWHLLVE